VQRLNMLAALAVALVLAACGGGSGGSSGPTVSAAALANCLRAEGLKPDTSNQYVDLIATSAANGSIRIEWPDHTFANISIWRSSSDAENAKSQYGSGLGEIHTIDQQGNVVVAYGVNTPTSEDTGVVDGCVNTSG
jgi:hypothetical protein